MGKVATVELVQLVRRNIRRRDKVATMELVQLVRRSSNNNSMELTMDSNNNSNLELTMDSNNNSNSNMELSMDSKQFSHIPAMSSLEPMVRRAFTISSIRSSIGTPWRRHCGARNLTMTLALARKELPNC